SEICRSLARAGRRVVAADLGNDDARVARFRDTLGELAARVTFEKVDVGDFDSCADLVRRIGPVDILVNAAGITRDVTLRKMSMQQWTDVLHVNLDSVFHMCRHVVDSMCDRAFGRIVNISSVNGQTGQFGQTNYSAAKAGIHGFTMALAREVARKGVTVNSVSPGYCRTTMIDTIPENVRNEIVAKIPVGRLCEPAEIARVVDFLTADDAGYITGANVPVNGGYFMDF
ncbi:MAG TPA: acetoacetyl-CoA reductase, partial [Xanthomonadales bacterium]|nr:acetoacetyl-CoA reductase [Xanthomonadales bacterium]